MRILARAVDVRVAERDEREVVLGVVEERVQLPRALADAVGAHRVRRMGLGRGKLFLLPVHRAARRDEEDAADVRLTRGLEEVDRAEDVDACVEQRVGDRAADVHLRGVMAQRGRTLVADELDGLRLDHVELVKARLRVQVLALAGREIIDHEHVVAGGDERVDDVRADEPGAARDQDLHEPSTTPRK